MKPPFLPNTTKFPAFANSQTEVKGLDMFGGVSSSRPQSLLAEIRDACSIRDMVSNTVQGSIGFHKRPSPIRWTEPHY